MAKSLDTISKAGKPQAASVAPPAKEPIPPTVQADVAVQATVPPAPEAVSAPSADSAQGLESAPPTPLSPAGDLSSDVTKADSYETLFPEPTVTISSPPAWIWWLLLAVAAIGLGLLGYGIANGKINRWLTVDATPTPVPAANTPVPLLTPTATPSISTSPTPTPSSVATPSAPPSATAPAPGAISLRVLNGTTKAGAATDVGKTLSQAGFKVTGVGNAPSQTATSTIIYYQTGQSAAAQEIQQQLSSYAPTLQESSSEANPYTALVVLGPTK
jgi:hypothetical protein